MARTTVLALARRLPEVEVAEEGRHIGLSVRGKRFAWYLEDHHGDGMVALACKAAPGVQQDLVARAPGRHFVPAYLGARGWVGIRLDREDVDWGEVDELLGDAYCLVAPKRLAAQVGT